MGWNRVHGKLDVNEARGVFGQMVGDCEMVYRFRGGGPILCKNDGYMGRNRVPPFLLSMEYLMITRLEGCLAGCRAIGQVV